MAARSAFAKENHAGTVVTVRDLAYLITGPQRTQQPLKVGDTFDPHDEILTIKNGSVKILLADHTVLDIGPATRFKLDEYVANQGSDRKVGVSVATGTLRTAVTQKITGNGSFSIRTKSATMGVRGTDLVTTVAPSGATQVTVLAGRIDLSSKAIPAPSPGGTMSRSGGADSTRAAPAKTMSLGAGQQVTAATNAPLPSKPVTLDAASLSKVSASAKVADNSFSKSVTVESKSSSSSTGSTTSSAVTTKKEGHSPAGSESSSGEKEGSSGSSKEGSSGGGSKESAAGGSKEGGSSGATAAAPPPPATSGGNSTLSEISNVVAVVATAPPPINISQIGIVGTFSPGTTTAPTVVTFKAISSLKVLVTHD